jgi:hypothetical protein
MSATQISFASFAAAQLAPATNSSQAELNSNASSDFDGPYIPWKGMASCNCAGDWNGPFMNDWQSEGNLDAPYDLPYGGHKARRNISGGIFADGFKPDIRRM